MFFVKHEMRKQTSFTLKYLRKKTKAFISKIS